MKLLFLILISLFIQGCDQPANEIKEANLHKHIKILASDEFEGRSPGSLGGEKTKLYLKNEFQKMGLPSIKGDYYLEVPLSKMTVNLDSSFLSITKMINREYLNLDLNPSIGLKEWLKVCR